MRRPTLTSTEKIAMTQADADQSHAPKDGADYDSTHVVEIGRASCRERV